MTLLNKEYFDYAMKMASSALLNSDMRVCHGFLSPEIGSGGADVLGDYSSAFAWIEANGVVYHFRTDQVMPVMGGKANVGIVEFYRLYQPTFVLKYSTSQCVRCGSKYASNGPWEDVLLAGKLLPLSGEDTRVTNIPRNERRKAIKRMTLGRMRASSDRKRSGKK